MPTGYTAKIQDGTITEFSDFAMICARNFGALIMMRDAPDDAIIPERFEPDTRYYDDNLRVAEAKLRELRSMTDAQVAEAAFQDHSMARRSWSETNERMKVERQRYDAMMQKVEAWIPPSPDHLELKIFMMDQINRSLEIDWYDIDEPAPPAPAEWLDQQITRAMRNVAYHKEKIEQEIARTNSRNEWLAQLRASLPLPHRGSLNTGRAG